MTELRASEPKVLMLNTNRGFIGGVERLMVRMAQALAEQSWRVYGLFEQSAHEDDDFDAAFGEIKIYDQDSLESLINYYKAEGIELVIIHKTEKSQWLSELQSAFKTVLIVHDHDYYCLRRHKYFPYKRINCQLPFNAAVCMVCSGMVAKQNGKYQLIDAAARLRLLKQVRKCDLSFVLSDYMRENLLKNGWQSSSIKTLIPFQEIGEPTPKDKQDVPCILYVGQLIRGKGVDLLLRALARVKPKFTCRILGRGNDEEYLKQLAKDLGISSRVEFAGFTTNPDLAYASADILVVPSRWQEPFGLVGLEAFAHKVPVIAFDTGGISQWLKHKVNGLLVPERDCVKLAAAITKLLEDPETAHMYGEAGYDLVSKQYTPATFNESFIPYLRELLHSSDTDDPKNTGRMSILDTLLREIVLRVLTLAIGAMILPGVTLWLALKRSQAKDKAIIKKRLIFGTNNSPIRIDLIDSPNWIVRNALLFALAGIGKISLVGLSFRDYDPIKPMPADLAGHKPGIFNLHFIRRSSKIAIANQDGDDRDYLNDLSLKNDLLLLLQSIPAIIYHHEAGADSDNINVFGIKMLNVTMAEAIDQIRHNVNDQHKSEVFFVNADCLNKVFVDRDYYSILHASTMIYPDGIGINLAGKMLGTALKENVNGTDMLPHLCEMAQAEGYSLYLLGAAHQVAETMKDKLLQSYPGLKICGARNGYFDWDSQVDSVIEEINAAGTDILLVAFGAPLQEKFIRCFAPRINASVLMGVGGLFDFYSGRIARAPMWMRQIGFEWVFRLIQEPKRMWKRYIIGNPVFLYRVFRWKVNRHYGKFE